MLCPSCGEDRSPIIEGDQSGRFHYTCANAGCHSNLGPVNRQEPAVAPEPAPAFAPARSAAAPAPVASTSITDLGPSLVETIRARIAALDLELAKADAMRVERRKLARMLAAAERSEKKPARLSNVLSLARGAS